VALLRIDIAGNPKTIPFRTVLQIGANSIGVLDDLDHAFSHEPQGALEWITDDVSTNGRLRIDLDSRVRQAKRKSISDVGSQVAGSFVSGLRTLEREGTTPPYLSEAGMRHARRMTNVLGHDGANRIIVSIPKKAEAEVTPKAYQNISGLLKAPYASLGSIEGHLEGINLHQSPRFIIYEQGTNKAVSCQFGPFRNELMDKIKDSLEKRVLVSGRLHRNAKGEPARIQLLSPDDLKVFDSDLKVLPFKRLRGSDPDFTSGESVSDYIRRMRG